MRRTYEECIEAEHCILRVVGFLRKGKFEFLGNGNVPSSLDSYKVMNQFIIDQKNEDETYLIELFYNIKNDDLTKEIYEDMNKLKSFMSKFIEDSYELWKTTIPEYIGWDYNLSSTDNWKGFCIEVDFNGNKISNLYGNNPNRYNGKNPYAYNKEMK